MANSVLEESRRPTIKPKRRRGWGVDAALASLVVFAMGVSVCMAIMAR